MLAATITASSGILIAVLAYWLNSLGETRRTVHRAKLEWVNSQLRELYGPLLVLTDVNETAWNEYKSRYLTEGTQRRRPEVMTEQEKRRWKVWMSTVFAPAGLQMRDTIMRHGDLIIGNEMPKVVLDFCSHVSSLEVLLAEWNSSEEEEEVLVRHPGSEFVEYVRASYKHLKEVQSILRSTS